MPLRERNNFLRNLSVHNLLSFQDSGWLDLQPLNVLIGPNASGKSNFIHAVSWIKSQTLDLSAYIRDLGGRHQLINQISSKFPSASIFFEVNLRDPNKHLHCHYSMAFDAEYPGDINVSEQVVLKDRTRDDDIPISVRSGTNGYQVFTNKSDYREGRTTYEGASFIVGEGEANTNRVSFDHIDGAKTLSILEILKDPVRFALQDYLAEQSRRVWIGEVNQISALSSIRAGQSADLSRNFLREDFSNLNGIINSIQGSFEGKQKLDESVARVNPQFKGIHIDVSANITYLSMYESEIKNAMPATRLSDGTLSLVCLLATLLQPNLPPVICIEEPELGLNPGVIHVVAELLHEASQRTQIIVTTHSEILVDAIGQLSPGAIMICERDQEGTHIARPDPEKLSAWMEKYTLGELWLSGEIGGMP